MSRDHWIVQPHHDTVLIPHYLTDVGSNNSGHYDLVAVLTHQGRSSSSGHYVGWVAVKNGESCDLRWSHMTWLKVM